MLTQKSVTRQTKILSRAVMLSPSVFAHHRSTGHIVYLRIHVVCGLDDLGIALIGALRQYHLDEFTHHVDVRALEISLLPLPQSLRPAWSVRDRISRRKRGLEEIAADRFQAAGIRECC